MQRYGGFHKIGAGVRRAPLHARRVTDFSLDKAFSPDVGSGVALGVGQRALVVDGQQPVQVKSSYGLLQYRSSGSLPDSQCVPGSEMPLR